MSDQKRKPFPLDYGRTVLTLKRSSGHLRIAAEFMAKARHKRAADLFEVVNWLDALGDQLEAEVRNINQF